MITTLGRLLADEHPNHPHAVLERARRPGRSMGRLARALEDFFIERGLALPTDQAERLAAGRRRRRIDAVPGRATTGGQLVRGRPCCGPRNEPGGPAPGPAPTTPSRPPWPPSETWPGSWIGDRSKQDWALVDVHDVEAFLAVLPKARHGG